MFRFGKIAMSSFIFQLKIDQKGFMGWLGLIKLLWVKKGITRIKAWPGIV